MARLDDGMTRGREARLADEAHDIHGSDPGRWWDQLASPQTSIRNKEKAELAAVGGRVVPVLLDGLTTGNVDQLIQTLNLLGSLGDSRAIEPIRRLLGAHPADSNVRFAAYEALGLLPVKQGVYTLAIGLQDDDHQVRMAAARAIERGYDLTLEKGLRNMIGLKDARVIDMMRAIIDAEADHVFLSLMPIALFQRFARAYLATRAHWDVRRHFLPLLQEGGYLEIAREIKQSIDQLAAVGPSICVVDDSKLILSLYRGLLTDLGFRVALFLSPLEALAALKREEPALLFTDLNMPELTGLALVVKVREFYPNLPIVMVTTQNESFDHDVAREVGINEVLLKPFNEDALEQVIRRWMK